MKNIPMTQEAMIIAGPVLKIGDNISTDHILPSRFMTQIEPAELAAHCLAGVDPQLAASVQPASILAAGENIGYGSSREQAPQALKHCGFRAVTAKTFARIFYRNCYNIGLPAIACPEFVEAVSTGDRVRIDLGRGVIHNETIDRAYHFIQPPSFLLDFIQAGGLIPHLRTQLNPARDPHHEPQEEVRKT
jgi:3-isopropylmalate/(R)-2-methylmalate dehydratase small subunit